MNPKSAEALVGGAVILNLAAFTVLSPTAWFGFSVLAAVTALIPVVFARKGVRIAGIVVLAASVAQAAWAYPAHQKFEKRILENRERAKERADKPKPLPPPPPAETKQ